MPGPPRPGSRADHHGRLAGNWDFLSDFQQRGTLALDALRAQAAQSPWGVASNGRILDEPRLRSMEEMYLPD